MKKYVQILSLSMALVMAFAIGTYAAAEADITEPTTAVQEESTTVPDTAVPEEETTTLPDTSQPEDETATQPDTTQPTVPIDPTEPTEPTDPTDPTEPEKPEITLPKAPTKITTGNGGFGFICVIWDTVEGAEGYDVYLKVNGEWVYQTSTTSYSTYIYNLISNSEYEVAVKSYITVDGVKYESEEYCTGVIATSASVNTAYLTLSATKEGIKLRWDKCEGISGYRIAIKKDGKWVNIADINDPDTTTYLYKNATKNTKYQFSIRSFAKGAKGTKWATRTSKSITYPDFTKAKITSTTPTNSAVTIKWSKVEDATGYRVYVYKNNKWTYYKGIKKTSYKVTGLEASSKYKFKVRAYYQAKGKTTWGTYSDEVTVTTKAKTVKAYRLANYKKYFTDGDWYVTLGKLKTDMGFEYTMTLAVKGDDIYVKYDYKEPLVSDIGYLIQTEKERVYLIHYKNKTYERLPEDEAIETAITFSALALIFDMENVKNVKAQTALYSGKAAVSESYTDKLLGIKKTYYFVGDSLKSLKLTYSDGSTESFNSIKISDTPSASYFKLPAGYKDFTRK